MAGFGAAKARKKVGMITALYRGKAYRTIPSRMEALGIATDFAPNVLTARLLEGGIHFGLGSTLAVSREALDAVGGLLPLVDYVADDYHLGARIAAKGFEVALSREVVETSVPPYTFPNFLPTNYAGPAPCGTPVRPATLAWSLLMGWHGHC